VSRSSYVQLVPENLAPKCHKDVNQTDVKDKIDFRTLEPEDDLRQPTPPRYHSIVSTLSRLLLKRPMTTKCRNKPPTNEALEKLTSEKNGKLVTY
jgi:hypothetical protein